MPQGQRRPASADTLVGSDRGIVGEHRMEAWEVAWIFPSVKCKRRGAQARSVQQVGGWSCTTPAVFRWRRARRPTCRPPPLLLARHAPQRARPPPVVIAEVWLRGQVQVVRVKRKVSAKAVEVVSVETGAAEVVAADQLISVWESADGGDDNDNDDEWTLEQVRRACVQAREWMKATDSSPTTTTTSSSSSSSGGGGHGDAWSWDWAFGELRDHWRAVLQQKPRQPRRSARKTATTASSCSSSHGTAHVTHSGVLATLLWDAWQDRRRRQYGTTAAGAIDQLCMRVVAAWLLAADHVHFKRVPMEGGGWRALPDAARRVDSDDDLSGCAAASGTPVDRARVGDAGQRGHVNVFIHSAAAGGRGAATTGLAAGGDRRCASIAGCGLLGSVPWQRSRFRFQRLGRYAPRVGVRARGVARRPTATGAVDGTATGVVTDAAAGHRRLLHRCPGSALSGRCAVAGVVGDRRADGARARHRAGQSRAGGRPDRPGGTGTGAVAVLAGPAVASAAAVIVGGSVVLRMATDAGAHRLDAICRRGSRGGRRGCGAAELVCGAGASGAGSATTQLRPGGSVVDGGRRRNRRGTASGRGGGGS
eukprot:ctg_1255.g483